MYCMMSMLRVRVDFCLLGGIGAGIRRSMRPRGKRSGVNLKEEVKQLMFPVSGPLCVSKDERLFKDVMMAFYHYEEAVSCTCT